MLSRAVADELAAIDSAVDWLRARCADLKVDESLSFNAQVCVEEALANLVLHGRTAGEAKRIMLALDPTPGGIRIGLRDNCLPFNIADQELAKAAADKAAVGGRGLRLMHGLTSRLDYAAGGEGNLLTLLFEAPDAGPDTGFEALRAIPAFASVPDDMLHHLRDHAAAHDYAPGDLIVAQGTPSPFAVILLRGAVDIIVARVQGEGVPGEAVVGEIAAPALVGEIGALAGLPRTAGVRARVAVSALHVGHEALAALARKAPDMLLGVIRQLGGQIHNVNEVLGLYAAGLDALERDDFDPAIIEQLSNPSAEMHSFQSAFRRLAERVLRERRARAEMASAALIQQSMLPAPIAADLLAGRCDLHGFMKPAREIGGDLFDHVLLEDGRIALVIGDVCGKGVPASLFMSVTVTALRVAAQMHPSDLGALVHLANQTMCANNQQSMFTTLIYAIFDPATGETDYAVCGHNRPILFGPGREPVELAGKGPPLGLFPDKRWALNRVVLGPGDGLFLYTDGITEAMNGAQEEYGEGRLFDLIAARGDVPMEALALAVDADVARFADGTEQSDDITCLAVRRLSAMPGGA